MYSFPQKSSTPNKPRKLVLKCIILYLWFKKKSLQINICRDLLLLQLLYRGERGIRTPGTVARTPHFECGPIDHSGISPIGSVSNGRQSFRPPSLSPIGSVSNGRQSFRPPSRKRIIASSGRQSPFRACKYTHNFQTYPISSENLSLSLHFFTPPSPLWRCSIGG